MAGEGGFLDSCDVPRSCLGNWGTFAAGIDTRAGMDVRASTGGLEGTDVPADIAEPPVMPTLADRADLAGMRVSLGIDDPATGGFDCHGKPIPDDPPTAFKFMVTTWVSCGK